MPRAHRAENYLLSWRWRIKGLLSLQMSAGVSRGQSKKPSHLINYPPARKYATFKLQTQSITSSKPRAVCVRACVCIMYTLFLKYILWLKNELEYLESESSLSICLTLPLLPPSSNNVEIFGNAS